MVLFQNTNWVLTFQKWRLTSDTRSFETKEILFHLALDLLLHVCKMHLLLVLVVFNLRGREPIQRKAKASFSGPWSLQVISAQFAREGTLFKERRAPECGQYQVENLDTLRIRSSV